MRGVDVGLRRARTIDLPTGRSRLLRHLSRRALVGACLALIGVVQLATAAAASADPPSVCQLAPLVGPSSGGTQVKISGYFPEATSVRFGSIEPDGFTHLNDNQIIAVSPPHAAGIVDVTVTTPAGTSTTCNSPKDDDFRYADPVGGSWLRDGLLIRARADLTTTRLADGRVLVVGGSDPDGNPATSAELYDPVARVERATAEMAVGRSTHTATLLADGRVLVVGGTNSQTGADFAEIYDPVDGVWAPAADGFTTVRNGFTATLLDNGKVLVVGGATTDGGVVVASTQLYDPATGTWSGCSPPATPSASCPGDLVAPRRQHTATRLSNGKVLVVAGKNPSNQTIKSTELYDPATGTWSSCSDATASATCPGPLAIQRFVAQSVTLSDGKALVIAGQQFNGVRIASVEEYDPATGRWGPTGFLASPRALFQATVLADGNVMATGGIGPDSGGTPVASAEIYDRATRRWTPTDFQIVPRFNHGAALLADGRVLVAGGFDGNAVPIGQSELWRASSALAPLPPAPLALVTPAPPGSPAAPAAPALTPFAGCPASSANVISGTAAADMITGTPRADRIFAAAGDDEVAALADDDCVDLGAGADRGTGGPGNDVLLGGLGNDIVRGGSGDDAVRGGASNDSLAGNAGNDSLLGGTGRDQLLGGLGDDRVQGQSGVDTLSGGGGSDRLTGGTGRDTISGGTGADVIDARDGQRDRISCGPGRDTVIADPRDRVARDCERVGRRGS